MVSRCKELRLRVTLPERRARQKALVVLTAQTMKGVYAGYQRIPL
jgi:hypothetical protein